jgi:hypothetical protein
MSMDLFCYSSKSPAEVEAIMKLVENQNKELFEKKFLISQIRNAGEIQRETALEYGLCANSIFLIRYNDKSAIDLAPIVVELTKKSLGVADSLILFENETLK